MRSIYSPLCCIGRSRQESLPESTDVHLCVWVALGRPHQLADPPHHVGLLRAYGERPCDR
jgi:hypothetical protein